MKRSSILMLAVLLGLGIAYASAQITDSLPRMVRDKFEKAVKHELRDESRSAKHGLIGSLVFSLGWAVISFAWTLVDLVGLLFLFSLLTQQSSNGGAIFHNVVHRFSALRSRIEDAIFKADQATSAAPAPTSSEGDHYLVQAVTWLLRTGAQFGFKSASKMIASSLLPFLYGLAFVWAMWDMVHQSGFKFSTLLLGLPIAWLLMPSRLFSVFTFLLWRAGDFGALLFALSFYKQA